MDFSKTEACIRIQQPHIFFIISHSNDWTCSLRVCCGDVLPKLRYCHAISIFKIVTSLWNYVSQKTDNYKNSKPFILKYSYYFLHSTFSKQNARVKGNSQYDSFWIVFFLLSYDIYKISSSGIKSVLQKLFFFFSFKSFVPGRSRPSLK